MNEDFNPPGYKRGKTKYIIVTGSVMSGVGKGTFTSSIATLFQFYELKVSMMKFDGYLNVDAGTLNPYRHGEVFVLDDGTETDLDTGSYERALHRNLAQENYLTGGKLFKMIVEKERRGEYLGRDVQFIPHVTGEIKKFIRQLALKDEADMLIVEVGGTVGDIENSYFIEAMRELKYEEGRENVAFVNVTYIIEPNSLGEQKSKAAQLGIERLMALGIQPDLVVCRATKDVTDSVKEKISMVSNIPMKNVISLKDYDSIYEVPFYLRKQQIDRIFLNRLEIKTRERVEMKEKWMRFLHNLKSREEGIEIALTGKYTGVHDSYLSILKALEHVGVLLKKKIRVRWIETTEIKSLEDAKKQLQGVKGLIVPGGFGSRGTEGKIFCIEYARKNNLPFLGLCLGLQLAVVEYARDVLKLNSNSTELDEKTKHPVIDILPEQRAICDKGGTMRLGGQETEIRKGTLAFEIYGKKVIRERFRHRYEVNPEYVKKLEEAGLIFSGTSKGDKRIMQIIELPKDKHKFFFASQFHPELLSRPLSPSKPFIEFVKSCLDSDEKAGEKSVLD